MRDKRRARGAIGLLPFRGTPSRKLTRVDNDARGGPPHTRQLLRRGFGVAKPLVERRWQTGGIETLVGYEIFAREPSN